MMTRICVFSFLMALASLPLPASPQESLGDLARQQRQEQVKAGQKTTKVYTNDNLPGRKRDESGEAASGVSSTPAATASVQAQPERDFLQAAKQTNQASESAQPATKSEKREDKHGTKEYWQARFKSARARLADAEERQQLAEDELNLLQIQDARELDSDLKAELAGKIKAREDEVSQKREATEQARSAFEDLQKEFQASRTPEEWSQEPQSSSQESEVSSQ
jgi:vacuolar-type H+-ATPase subunit I/STV1